MPEGCFERSTCCWCWEGVATFMPGVPICLADMTILFLCLSFRFYVDFHRCFLLFFLSRLSRVEYMREKKLKGFRRVDCLLQNLNKGMWVETNAKLIQQRMKNRLK